MNEELNEGEGLEGTEGLEQNGEGQEGEPLEGEQELETNAELETTEQEPVEGTQAQTQSRARDRIQRQQEEVREARRTAEEAQRKTQELERQMAEIHAQRQRADQEAQMQFMSPEERAVVESQRQMQSVQSELQRLQFQMQDTADRAAFAAKAASDARYAKYQDKVEQELTKLRNVGQTAPRESVLAYLIGKEVIDKAPAAVAKQRKEAANRMQNAQGRAVSGRGDAGRSAPGSDDSLESLEERLKNAVF